MLRSGPPRYRTLYSGCHFARSRQRWWSVATYWGGSIALWGEIGGTSMFHVQWDNMQHADIVICTQETIQDKRLFLFSYPYFSLAVRISSTIFLADKISAGCRYFSQSIQPSLRQASGLGNVRLPRSGGSEGEILKLHQVGNVRDNCVIQSDTMDQGNIHSPQKLLC